MDASTEVLRVEEAAGLLRCSRSTAYKLASSGELPTIRIGRLLRVPRVQLERMLSGERESEEERR